MILSYKLTKLDKTLFKELKLIIYEVKVMNIYLLDNLFILTACSTLLYTTFEKIAFDLHSQKCSQAWLRQGVHYQLITVNTLIS